MAVSARNIYGDKETSRRLKTHRKSRWGCGNCKLRKIKCDETKPTCKRCGAYGTFCNYDRRYSALQPLAQESSGMQSLQTLYCSENQTILGIVNSTTDLRRKGSLPVINGGYQICLQDLELLHKFHNRTIFTLGTAQYRHLYRNAYAKLIYSHPFLLHVVLTLTIMHDRYLGIGSPTEQSAAIAFHWSQGAALLNRRLSASTELSERDALWACAGLLGALGFASIQATIPEEVWPLKQSSPLDLDWLNMSEGKKAIWKIADPLRVDSIFHPITPDFMQYSSLRPYSRSELQELPPEIIQLCGLDDDASTQEGNPYLPTASFTAQTINVECNTNNVGRFLSFLGCMHPGYKHLLGQKDPAALLLLAYWYAKIRQCRQWWIWRRASLECQAICEYLTRYHGADDNILKSLQHLDTVYTT